MMRRDRDGNDTDGCRALQEAPWDEYDDDETASLRALFPDGDPARADEWRALFGGEQ